MKVKEKRKCKVCKVSLVGRKDKVFCSLHCKNHYHSILRSHVNLRAKEVNGYLIRNYEILWETLGSNKTQVKVHRHILVKQKFRFKYHTHTYVNKKNNTYFFIYNLAWMEFLNEEVLIVKR